MYRSKLWLFLLPVVFTVCNSTPPAESGVVTPTEVAAVEQPLAEQSSVEQAPAEPAEDPEAIAAAAIYQEMYNHSLGEIQIFHQNLDAIVRSRNFDGWRDTLTDERFAEISSAEFLANASQSPLLSSRRIVLRSARDYFVNVVVPSHSSTRVDEIEFITENSVKVYYITPRTVRNAAGETHTEITRLRLYELIKLEDAWKIVN